MKLTIDSISCCQFGVDFFMLRHGNSPQTVSYWPVIIRNNQMDFNFTISSVKRMQDFWFSHEDQHGYDLDLKINDIILEPVCPIQIAETFSPIPFFGYYFGEPQSVSIDGISILLIWKVLDGLPLYNYTSNAPIRLCDKKYYNRCRVICEYLSAHCEYFYLFCERKYFKSDKTISINTCNRKKYLFNSRYP